MITVVIPTIGRRTLAGTLAAVGAGVPVIVVDDRKVGAPTRADGSGTGMPFVGGGARTKEHDVRLPVFSDDVPGHVRIVPSGGRGPAAARNAGWRAADTPWVVFLDDDVIPSRGWAEALWKDLADLPADVAGSQGRIEVPLPPGRRPTDGERHTAGLADASWVTADMAYRRGVLESIGGFDERFPRAYREDADLALRVTRAGHRLVRGERVTTHPVRADGFWASVRFQRGNADDALMRRLYGAGWRAAIGGARGRLRAHAATTGTGLAGVALTAAALGTRALGTRALGCRALGCRATGTRTTGSRARGARAVGARVRARPGGAAGGPALPVLAVLAGAVWAAMTAEFAWRRIVPGPRTPAEVLRMVVTSVVIPPVACVHRLRGEWRVRR
ncbi:glycosyltransferase family 2 protein [Nonomuraea sp. NPDC002799]